jgi:hypothetical protein
MPEQTTDAMPTRPPLVRDLPRRRAIPEDVTALQEDR